MLLLFINFNMTDISQTEYKSGSKIIKNPIKCQIIGWNVGSGVTKCAISYCRTRNFIPRSTPSHTVTYVCIQPETVYFTKYTQTVCHEILFQILIEELHHRLKRNNILSVIEIGMARPRNNHKQLVVILARSDGQFLVGIYTEVQ